MIKAFQNKADAHMAFVDENENLESTIKIGDFTYPCPTVIDDMWEWYQWHRDPLDHLFETNQLSKPHYQFIVGKLSDIAAQFEKAVRAKVRPTKVMIHRPL